MTTTETYNFLRSFFTSKAYATVSYDPETRLRTLGASAPISSLELNEESSGFEPSHNKRNDYQHHAEWTWSVLIAFNSEVDFSVLRAALEETPRINGTRVVVRRARYTHPPRQEPNIGSRAEFVLNVLVHPQ